MSIAKYKGFTLIELMIVVAIVAIIAVIAYPNYTRYAFRARRAEGKDLAMRVAAQEERFYTTRNLYTTNIPIDLGFATTSSERGYYTVSAAFVAGNNQRVVITATPAGIQAADACGSLQINNSGVKSWTGATTNGNCW